MNTKNYLTKLLFGLILLLQASFVQATCVDFLTENQEKITDGINEQGHLFIEKCADADPNVYIAIIDLSRNDQEINITLSKENETTPNNGNGNRLTSISEHANREKALIAIDGFTWKEDGMNFGTALPEKQYGEPKETIISHGKLIKDNTSSKKDVSLAFGKRTYSGTGARIFDNPKSIKDFGNNFKQTITSSNNLIMKNGILSAPEVTSDDLDMWSAIGLGTYGNKNVLVLISSNSDSYVDQTDFFDIFTTLGVRDAIRLGGSSNSAIYYNGKHYNPLFAKHRSKGFSSAKKILYALTVTKKAPLTALTCGVGSHIEGDVCVVDSVITPPPSTQVCTPASNESKVCNIVNGSGSQNKVCTADGLSWSEYSSCIVSSCDSGYHKLENNCVVDVIITPPSAKVCTPESGQSKACIVANGSGLQNKVCSVDGLSWLDYESCIVSSCDDGYLKEGNNCVIDSSNPPQPKKCTPSSSESIACNIENGLGSQSKVCAVDGLSWSEFSNCSINACSNGYHKVGNSCVVDVVQKKPPIVDAGKDRTITLSAPVMLEAVASDSDGTIISYEWDETNEPVSEDQGVVLTTLNLGKHTFKIEVTDNDGLKASDEVEITVVEDQTLRGSLSGRTLDQKGVPIPNAKVTLVTGQNTVSNDKAEYIFLDLAAIERSTVTASKNNFLENSEIYKIELGKETIQDIVLSRPASVTKISTTTETIIETEGLTVELPKGVYTNEQGVPVESEITLSASYFPITTEEGINEFPGDTLAINDEGEIGDLTSFGFIKLELKDEEGNDVKIPEGEKVELSIPADDSLDKPETIPFWYFDEETSLWVEDGVATYDPVTNTYKTSVDTVKTFNLDSYGDVLASLEVCIEDTQGNKVEGYAAIEPVNKSWRKLSKTSKDGLLRLNGIIGESGFNLYAASIDGDRLGEFQNNPLYIGVGDNKPDECIIVDDTDESEALKIIGTVVDQDGNAKPGTQVKIYSDVSGQTFGNAGLVELTSVVSNTNGEFTVNFNREDTTALEVALLGNKNIVVKVSEGTSKGQKELILEKGTSLYDLSDITLFNNKPPVPNAGVDQTIYIDQGVNFISDKSYDPGGTIKSYEWRDGDKIISNLSSFHYANLSIGEHLIILTITDNNDLKASDEMIVKVIDRTHELHANAGVDQTYYVGEHIIIASESISIGSAISYQWKKGNEVIDEGYNFDVQDLGVGVHTITHTVTNEHGLTDSDEIVITIKEKEHFLYADAGLDKTFYIGENIQLANESFSIGSQISYEWKEGNTVLSDNYWLSQPVLGVGVHTITLTVTNEQGLVDSDDIVITIVEKDHFLYADAGLDRMFYVGENIQLANESFSIGSQISYEWKEGDTVLSESYWLSQPALGVGVHTITLTVSNEHGLTETDEVVITIAEKNLGTGNIFADAGRDIAGYLGDEIDVGNGESYTLTGDSLEYQWKEGNTLLSTDTEYFFYQAQAVGIHTITLIVTDENGLVDTDEVIVTVTERPKGIHADAGGNQAVYLGNVVIVGYGGESYSLTSDLEFQWKEGNTVLSTEYDYFSYKPETLGIHTILLTVTDEDGLVDTDEVTVTVTERPKTIFADAGLDKAVLLGNEINVGGGESYSLTSDIEFQWFEGNTLLSTEYDSFTYKPEKLGLHTITLIVTDEDGLVDSDEVTVLVTAVEGNIYADAGIDQEIYQGATADLDASESYSFGDNLSYEWKEGDTVLGNSYNLDYIATTLGDHIITLTVTDENDLVDTDEVTITVVSDVVIDVTEPVITLNGEAVITITQGDVYTDLGATAVDDRDGVITSSITTYNPLFTTFRVDNYHIVYTVKDRAGNTTDKTRTVKVVASGADSTAPVITLIGENPVTLIKGASYSDAGVTVLDNRDGVIGYSFSNSLNTAVAGQYEVVYTATDQAGNISTETRQIIVESDPNAPVDSTPPIITLVGDADITLTIGDSYNDAGATAQDNTDGDITDKISADNPVNIGVAKVYTVTYTVKDEADNETRLTRQVTVEKKPDEPDPVDSLPPILLKSLTWLEAQKQADGSYTNSAKIAMPIQSTAEVLRAYKNVGEVSAAGIAPANSYLASQNDNKVEMLSRKLIARVEAGGDKTALLAELLQTQNRKGGFGDQGHYHSRVIDTAFALEALGVAKITNAETASLTINHLITKQSENGGFTHSSKNKESVYDTSMVLMAFQQFQSIYNLSAIVNPAAEYLMQNQTAGGGWDSNWETAYAILAIKPTAANKAAYTVAVDRLKAAQLSNGSWDNDVYTTALAIRAIYKADNE